MRPLLCLAALLCLAQPVDAPAAQQRHYTVIYDDGVPGREARAAIRGAGGVVVRENRKVGVATVRARTHGHVAGAARTDELLAVIPTRAIGSTATVVAPGNAHARASTSPPPSIPRGTAIEAASAATEDPLHPRQWNMAMIGASLGGTYRHQQAGRAVRVGILDSGIEASHPDISANLNRGLSRNFTHDIPEIDGPCEEEPDASCADLPGVDENGHGTHMAGLVAGAMNGRGISGVAPRAQLLDLRVVQDTGFVFLLPVVDALTYAADNGVDVVNMSFSLDPWLFACAENPADPPEDQDAQRAIIEGLQRALDYARARGVTAVAALGDDHTDLDRPEIDWASPSFPIEAAYERDIDDGCVSLPAEATGVIGVSAVGPSLRKAHYSNFGAEATDLAAPGGDLMDPAQPQPLNGILGPYPAQALRDQGLIDAAGAPTDSAVVRECRGNFPRRRCWYYRYLQGTGTAAAHVTGAAALIVAEHGRRDRVSGGHTLAAGAVERKLLAGARDLPCPEPRLFEYPDDDLPPEYNAYCEDHPDDAGNGFFGHGLLDAAAALRR